MAPEHELDPQRLPDHLDRLYRAAWALCGAREDAEDLVQDTIARVIARPRVIRGDDDVGYLLRVLRNTFISSRRSAARRPVSAELPEGGELLEDLRALPPDAVLEAREVYAAISALPTDFRDVLVAVDVVGLSYGEASRALRVREATITTRLYRARQRVARALGGGGGDGRGEGAGERRQ